MKYQNLDDIDKNKINLRKLIRYFLIRNNGKDLSSKISIATEQDLPFLQQNRSQLTYTWIGHSTFLIQLNGLNILTDPVFSNRMGTEKRLVPPGINLFDLPEMDIVLISHAHFDHLEFSSLKKLKGSPTFYVPVGLKKLCKQKGLTNIIEANWWDSLAPTSSITIHFVPAQHWSRRSLFDKNRVHWGGWVIESSQHTFYFVGDTGYFHGFKEIGIRFSIDTVFMPIGDYEPEWMSGLQHLNPEEAVQAFQDVGACAFVPMHYGTYRLSMDTGPEALERLKQEWSRQKLSFNHLHVLKIGETTIGQ
ncbi:outer membrane protein romA [Halalkalibacter wakoensis JCM 9140]|uniref:Outer membrane protein romA n=1 Tax=Halalkalibacter wakoensis JCM 9140 TaxID=1236970 RepID=W4Q8I5_9BACI|nr:MBL fold metallo-hydrolase [Halalkalibacter wakoensis]GAE28295.1 outer membrane protein romA [Halalkalibacter wakoensis JCM 9140]